MDMPRFTAEASLYKTSGHYQTEKRVINLTTQTIRVISPAMIREDGIDCGNCVGGECVELHCFENWTQGGGGAGGPYQGSSGGVGGGGLRGPGETCWWKPFCVTGCNHDASACRDRCVYDAVDRLGGDITGSIKDPKGYLRGSIRLCDNNCARSKAQCLNDCEACQ